VFAVAVLSVVPVVASLLCLHGSLVAVVACWWVSLISAEEKKTDFVEEVFRDKYQFHCILGSWWEQVQGVKRARELVVTWLWESR
jgi:hypothetical protein